MTDKEFENLLNKCHSSITRVVGKNLSGFSREDINDVVQEVCVALLKCHRNGKLPVEATEEERFRKYALGIARNKSKDHLRKQYISPKQKDTEKENSDEKSDKIQLIDLEQIKDFYILQDNSSAPPDIAAINQTLERLSPLHREIIHLRLLEGYQTDETAEFLGVPEGTVKSRLNKAKQDFKKNYYPTE